MTRFVLPLVAALLLIGFFFAGLERDPSALPSQYIGKPAPEFDLPGLKNPAVRFANADLQGQVALVNVWATWCVGCKAEHPFLNALSSEGKFPIYGLNWRDQRGAALQWLQQYGDPYVKSGFDGDGRAGIDWGVYGAPETFLITPEGRVVYRFAGPLNRASWEREFLPRIAGLRQAQEEPR